MFRKKKSSDNLGSAAKTTSTADSKKAQEKAKPTPPTVEVKGKPASQPPAKLSAKPAGAAEAKPSPPLVKSTKVPPAASTEPPPPAAAVVAEAKASSKVIDKAARKAKGAKGFFKRAPTIVGIRATAAEATRLQEDKERTKNWKRWGPYLSERQWATVREDYSPDGSW